MNCKSILFIDASNFNQVLKRKYKNNYDIKKLIQLIECLTKTDIIKTHYYITKFQNSDSDIKKQTKFFNSLKYIPNFELHTYDLQKNKDMYHVKELYTDMSFDMQEYKDFCDNIIFISENSEFITVVHRIQKYIKNVIMILPDCGNAHHLRTEVDEFIILTDEHIKSIIKE